MADNPLVRSSSASVVDRPTELVLGSVQDIPVPVKRSWHVGVATGIGSLPGDSPDEAARTVAGELPDLPHLAELPDRGVGADMVGRSAGLLIDIFAEVVPSGWRVTRRPGRDTRRAKDFMEWDLDAATEQYAGADWVKIQVCGPWTLAAQIEVASGNRALVDPGAVDDMAASLTQGLIEHLADLGSRLTGTSFVVQIDEPALPLVISGALSTPSGFGTVRAVDRSRVGHVLKSMTEALSDFPMIAHCCHPNAPLRLLAASGFDALSVDFTEIGTSAAKLDPIGELVEAGTVLLAGVLPGVAPTGRKKELQDWAVPVLGTFDRLGFPRETLSARVVPTPTCGLAGADQDWALAAMKISRELSHAFQDLPEGW
jgi:hypothetical protein